MVGGGTLPGRRVMVVAEPNRESASALQYALSHVVVENDVLILLHLEHPNSNAWRIPFSAIFRRPSITNASSTVASPTQVASASSSSVESPVGCVGGFPGGGGSIDFLEAMKHACGIAFPNLKVQAETVEMGGNGKDKDKDKDKASVILAQCEAQGVELLIIGQRTTLSNAILGPRRSRSIRGLDTAEYLIENSKCTCVGVQRKGMGGYLLNSKTHKNFWLLA